jgi:transcriptional regulator with XRE-family HTH domain
MAEKSEQIEENLVKKTCRELGITQKELAEIMGVNSITPSQWITKDNIPEWASKFMSLILENNKNKEIADTFKNLLRISKQ